MTNGIVQNTLATIGYLIIASSSASASPSASLTTLPAFTQEYVHVVVSGDSLTGIAEKEYGSRDYWTTIINDNPDIKDPNMIEVGVKLKMRTEKPVLVESLKSTIVTKEEPSIPLSPVPSVAPIAQAQPSNYDDVYKQAGAKYGVPWEILYGLHLTETGCRDGAIFNHSGSGARGPMQFMPGTWSAYGVDGNGDGVADIDNAVDAIHGAANFIAKHGSVENGLRYYGGNTAGVLAAARSRGYTL